MHPNDLLRHRCHRIRLGNERIYHWDFERGEENIALDVPGTITIDDTSFVLALTIAAAGLAYLPEPYVTPLVRRGTLRVVLEDWSSVKPGFHMYYSGRRQLPTGLRLLIELIRELRPFDL